jgi:hypothetical protein
MELAALLCAAAVGLGACGDHPAAKPQDVAPSTSADPIVLEPRTQLLPTFPCSRCHQNREPNPVRRKLVAFHAVRNAELNHGDRKLWCYQCHSIKDIDKLVIASGALVTLDQADQLCGSCHGEKGRDWRLGIHGTTQGHWRGEHRRKLCTHCHDPHNPWFATLEPEPPPAPPRGIGASNAKPRGVH